MWIGGQLRFALFEDRHRRSVPTLDLQRHDQLLDHLKGVGYLPQRGGQYGNRGVRRSAFDTEPAEAEPGLMVVGVRGQRRCRVRQIVELGHSRRTLHDPSQVAERQLVRAEPQFSHRPRDITRLDALPHVHRISAHQRRSSKIQPGVAAVIAAWATRYRPGRDRHLRGLSTGAPEVTAPRP